MPQTGPFMISRMRLDHYHRSHYALVRTLTPPDRITAIVAIFEDEQSTATLLQLYHQPKEDKARKEQILRKGRHLPD
jgi:hypothetical protein